MRFMRRHSTQKCNIKMKIWASTTLAAAAALAATPTAYAFTQSLGVTARPSSASSISESTSQLLKQSVATATSSSTSLAAEGSDESFPTTDTDLSDVGFVLLAGGTGSRMKANMPKQYLTLRGMPVLHHSLDLFLERLPVFARENGKSGPPMVVLVMDPKYQPEYQPIVDKYAGRLAFANPGEERQGSVENGLDKLVELAGDSCKYVAVHDSARPLVTVKEICDVVSDAKEHGAAVLGVPCKATIKESEDGSMVLRTIPRARLWEVHTPQVIKIDTLQRGFAKVEAENLEVTDDVSIVEQLGEPVKLTLGEYTNLKITTPEDMNLAISILDERKMEPVDLLDEAYGWEIDAPTK